MPAVMPFVAHTENREAMRAHAAREWWLASNAVLSCYELTAVFAFMAVAATLLGLEHLAVWWGGPTLVLAAVFYYGEAAAFWQHYHFAAEVEHHLAELHRWR